MINVDAERIGDGLFAIVLDAFGTRICIGTGLSIPEAVIAAEKELLTLVSKLHERGKADD